MKKKKWQKPKLRVITDEKELKQVRKIFEST